MRVAITGSSGLIGTELRGQLGMGGHEVVRVERGAPGTAPVVWQPAAGWIQPGALEGCDAVVHLAGASIGDGRWSERRKKELWDSRIDSTRLLIDHLETLERKPSVLLCASAIGFYGNRGDEDLREDAPRGGGFLAELVEAWETEARRAEALGIRVVLMRSSIVLSQRGGALAKMLTPFKLGAGGRLGSGKQWMSWVALEDEAAAMIWALTHEDISGPVNLATPHPVRNSEFTKVLGGVLHRPTLFPVPPFGLKLLFGQMGEELLLYSQRIVPEKLQRSGFTFRHAELEGGLQAALGKPKTARQPSAA